MLFSVLLSSPFVVGIVPGGSHPILMIMRGEIRELHVGPE